MKEMEGKKEMEEREGKKEIGICQIWRIDER